MTRKERHIRVLRLVEEWLSGESAARTESEVLEAVRYALGAPCPPWWAEHVYEERAIEREHREEQRVLIPGPMPAHTVPITADEWRGQNPLTKETP